MTVSYPASVYPSLVYHGTQLEQRGGRILMRWHCTRNADFETTTKSDDAQAELTAEYASRPDRYHPSCITSIPVSEHISRWASLHAAIPDSSLSELYPTTRTMAWYLCYPLAPTHGNSSVRVTHTLRLRSEHSLQPYSMPCILLSRPVVQRGTTTD